MMMRFHGETLGRMAACAQRVASREKLQAVRVVAVAAGDARRVHLALEERAVLVDLVVDLTVGEIETLIEERRTMGVEQRMSVGVALDQATAARVAAGAGFELEP